MRFYIHPVNPHYAATHADCYFEGWCYGLWEHPYPAAEPALYSLLAKTLPEAKTLLTQAQTATQHLADTGTSGAWLKLPKKVAPHDPGAVDTYQDGVRGKLPVGWPWTSSLSMASR